MTTIFDNCIGDYTTKETISICYLDNLFGMNENIQSDCHLNMLVVCA